MTQHQKIQNRSTLEQELAEAWTDIVKRFYHPALRPAVLLDEVRVCDTALFDFLTQRTEVSARFIDELVEAGISAPTAFRGLLTHEIGHFMVFPRSLTTAILMGYFAERMFKEHGALVYAQYDDVVDNTYFVLRSKFPELKELLDTVQQMNECKKRPSLMSTLCSLYYAYQARISFTVPEELATHFAEMQKINFADDQPIHNHYGSLYQFGTILLKLLPEEDNGGLPTSDYFSDQLSRIDSSSLRKALREIMKGAGKERAEQIKKWVEDKVGNAIFPAPSGQKQGIGFEADKFQVDQDTIDYYRELAKAHPLHVVKKPGAVDVHDPFPATLNEWNTDYPIDRMNLFQTAGRVLPGITQRWDDDYLKRVDTELKVPDLLLVIDSSGSMPDPAHKKSYAALGGACLANTYLVNDARVGVVNFSGTSLFLDFTTDLQAIYGMIVGYQGGGTVVDMDVVKKMLDRSLLRKERADGLSDTIERLRDMIKDDGVGKEETKESDTVRDQVMDLVSEGVLSRDALKKHTRINTYDMRFTPRRQGIDLVMITDGGILNLEETLRYLQERSALNRATIIHVNRWGIEAIDVPNVTYYRVDKESEILDIAIGVQKDVLPVRRTQTQDAEHSYRR